MSKLTQLIENVFSACRIKDFDWNLNDQRSIDAKHILLWAAHRQLSMNYGQILRSLSPPEKSVIPYAVRKIDHVLAMNPNIKIGNSTAEWAIAEILKACPGRPPKYNLKQKQRKHRKISKPEFDTTEEKLVKCLGGLSPNCPKMFLSPWEGERVCPKCKDTAEWRSGAGLSQRIMP